MQQKTIFLSFYKAKDYFFDLGIKTKELCLQYICSWETPEACSQKCSSKRTNIFLEEHHWGTASGTFGNVLHYFSAISPFFQKQSTKETQEAVSQMCSSKKWTPFEKKTFGELLLELLKEFSIVFLCSVLLLSTFWQIYFKCFLHTALLVFGTDFDFGEFLFLSTFAVLAFRQCKCDTDFCHQHLEYFCCFWWHCYLQNFMHFCYYCLL